MWIIRRMIDMETTGRHRLMRKEFPIIRSRTNRNSLEVNEVQRNEEDEK